MIGKFNHFYNQLFCKLFYPFVGVTRCFIAFIFKFLMSLCFFLILGILTKKIGGDKIKNHFLQMKVCIMYFGVGLLGHLHTF